MEKDRKFRALAIAAICVAVVGVSVAYAALSASLTISGTGTVASLESTWNVKWVNNSPTMTCTEGVTVEEAGQPKIAGNNVTFAATFSKPGASCYFTVDITNAGTLNAKLLDSSDFITTVETDQAIFDYTVNLDTEAGASISTKANSILLAGNTQKLYVKVALKNLTNAEYETAAGKTVTFNLDLDFEQAADGEVTPELGSKA